MNNIEVEERALLTKQKYIYLFDYLLKNAQDLGEDNKDVVFYIYDDKLIKVVDEVSKNNAKIVYKDNNIAKSTSLHEIEVNISRSDFENAVSILNKINSTSNIMKSFQKRHNFLLDSCEIALKYSDVWGYHVEIEIMANSKDNNQIKKAKEQIAILAQKLDVQVMNQKELTNFTDKVESGYKRGLEIKGDRLLQQDEPIIHQKSISVDPNDKHLPKDILDLYGVLDESKLSGIAAPQIGILKRIIIVRNKRMLNNDKALVEADYRETVLVNPDITEYSESTTELYEGCGSVEYGKVFGLVRRPEKITVKYLDKHGKSKKLTTGGFLARVIQHEYDHLDGILFTDKLKAGTKLISMLEYLKFKEKEKLDKNV